MVEQFHKAFKCHVSDKPTLDVPQDVIDVRKKLIQEELNEIFKAIEDKDLVNLLKEYCDELYVVFGGIVNHGLSELVEKGFELVHLSNMSKLGEDGKPIYREDGKVLKGPNYKAPDLTVLFKDVNHEA